MLTNVDHFYNEKLSVNMFIDWILVAKL